MSPQFRDRLALRWLVEWCACALVVALGAFMVFVGIEGLIRGTRAEPRGWPHAAAAAVVGACVAHRWLWADYRAGRWP